MRSALSIAVAFFLVLPGAAQAKSYYFARTAITAEVRTDGSMHMREERDYVFSGNFHEAWRTIPLSPGARVVNFMVFDGATRYLESKSDQPGARRVTSDGDVFEAHWFYDVTDETRTFIITYDVTGAIQKHADFAELYWRFVGDEWEVESEKT